MNICSTIEQWQFLLVSSKLYDRRYQLKDFFGDEIFIKPDACVKSFSGFSTSLDNLKQEIEALKQIGNVQKEELIWIDSKKNLPEFEYRCWIVEKNILSPVGYSFYKDHKDAPFLSVQEKLLIVQEIL